ncbi:MAG: hypothetical protein LBE74_04320 [Treponema sp.]|nr:hypothetical protein [Treponema sp.]
MFVSRIRLSEILSKSAVYPITDGIAKNGNTLITDFHNILVDDQTKHKIFVWFLPDKSLTEATRSAPLNRLHGVENGPIVDGVQDKASGAINSVVAPGRSVQLKSFPNPVKHSPSRISVSDTHAPRLYLARPAVSGTRRTLACTSPVPRSVRHSPSIVDGAA